MPLVPKNYDRNLRDPRSYSSTAVVGGKGFNPQIKYYYGTNDETELIRVEQRFQLGTDEIGLWSQTISGSAYTKQWPAYDHYIIYEPWEEATTTGTL